MKVKILLILITVCLSLLKAIEAEEEESITFTLPQALLINPEFSMALPQMPQLESKIIYEFDYLYGPNGRDYLRTKIGTLGLITTSVCKKSKVLAVTYASLPRSLPECEIVIPGGFKVEDVSDYALQMMVVPAKSGPKYLEVCLKTDQGYTKSIQLGIRGSTFVLIPLTLFGERASIDIKGIKFVVPRKGDRDGIGGYFIKGMKLVLKASGMN